MPTVITSAPQQQVAMPAIDLRRMLAVGVAAEGVALTGDLLVAQRAAGANMSVDVAAGACYIADDHASGGGYYFARWDALENVVISAADPSNPRVDRVVVRVRDAFLADAANDVTLFVQAGTPTTGATLANANGAATLLGSSLLLANVLVGAGVTSLANAVIDSTGASKNSPLIRPLVSPAGYAWREVAYVEFTAGVTVSATVASTPTDIVSSGAIVYAGVPTIIEFFAPRAMPVTGASGNQLFVTLWDDTTDRGRLGVVYVDALTAAPQAPIFIVHRIAAPSAGAHTYKIRGYRITNNWTVDAGAGGVDTLLPGYVRVLQRLG